MDLFESTRKKELSGEPLASRMRPRTLDEYVGQDHIVGKGRLLRRAIQMDQLSSIILYGPPGTGKTTLARVIANTTKSHFSTMNAVLAGLKELDAEIHDAKERLDLYGKKTILFIDEVHRWNKRQQDALLPWVENGTVILIGATTENPYFEVNAALVSRSRIFQLRKLEEKDLERILSDALSDKERGYGKYNVVIDDDAKKHLIEVSAGDARSLLNALELAVETTGENFPPKDGEVIHITREIAEESIQQKAVLYDKEGDYHFDVISAFIKSLRGSDPDASMYWLSRMVKAGEDPRFIFRRMLILACEDVGLADPFALTYVESAAEAFDRVGLPEGRYHLALAALYLATCEKSNSSMAFFDALKSIEEEKDGDVPNHLKDASRDKEGFGHGEGYLYPHAYRDHWVSQQYLPTGLKGKVFYIPSSQGYEKTIRDKVLEKREVQLESVTEDEWEEELTHSPKNREKEIWIERAMGEKSALMRRLRSELLSDLEIRRYSNTLTLNASRGLLLWPLMRLNPEGLSMAFVRNKEDKEVIEHFAREFEEVEKPEVIVSESDEKAFSEIDDDLYFSVITGKNVLTRLEKSGKLLSEIKRHLEKDGKLLLLETIPKKSTRLSELTDGEISAELKEAEERIYSDNPLSRWDETDLENLIASHFESVSIRIEKSMEKRYLSKESVRSWWERSYSKFVDEKFKDAFISSLADREVDWRSEIAVIKGTNSDLKKKKTPSQDEWKRVHQITKENS